MNTQNILDLRSLVLNGTLFHTLDDHQRLEAFIPLMGYENHASNAVCAILSEQCLPLNPNGVLE